eukprot:TRINITY_DN58671_c0_g1_i1.p1 TRINITY_DN58671_c0_g1~~TRINITY_DN58671_c0_g1_i1.p1  ORF type:complete len:268 (-),score=66.65 TRINITY_DN58671_c0_g1_i1:360-1163(-)
MGQPLDDAFRQRQQQQQQGQDAAPGREFLDAPLRMQAESYEAFRRQLRVHGEALVGGKETSTASVEEELRKLDIDPAVFYRNAKPLNMCEYSAEDADPTSASSEIPAYGAGVSGMAAAILAASGGDGGSLFSPPERKKLSDGDTLGWATKTSKVPADFSDDEAAFEDESLKEPDTKLSLNVPDYEEICLDEGGTAATMGGRLGRETPRGLEAKLQIDTLTDDEDDPFINGPSKAQPPPAGDEEEAVEAFSLDPDFDYDNPGTLSRRC